MFKCLYTSLDGLFRPSYPSWYPLSNTPLVSPHLHYITHPLDYSIYHPSITLKQSDNDQLSVSSLKSYKQTFGVIRTMLSLLYDTDRTVIQSRMVYDATKTQIRVSFNAKLIPKSLITRPIHIDGISVYSIDLSRKQYIDTNTKEIQVNDCAGKIIEHKLDKLLVNGQPLAPPYLNVFGLDGMVGNRQGALVGAGAWS